MSNSSSSVAVTRNKRLDHLVLPVDSIETARARYSALGFTVAPDARHPFGTENCCIYFSDGSYLEPLGIAQRETCESAAKRGNVFVARDQAFRFRNPGDGFSALAFSSDDAAADGKSFAREGISAGRMLKFKRLVSDGKSEPQEISFAMAFAGDLRSPDFYFLACQRSMVPDIDFGRLRRHPNGVKSIKEILICEANPSDFQYLLETVIGQREVNAHSFGIELQSETANINVLSPVGMKTWFGEFTEETERGLIGRGAVLGVTNLEKTRELIKSAGIQFREIANRIIVPPAPGQGLTLAFEAHK